MLWPPAPMFSGHALHQPELAVVVLGQRGIEGLDPGLVALGQAALGIETVAIGLGILDQARLERVVHDRVRVPVRALHAVGLDLADDVVEGGGAVPAVGRLGERGVDRLLVPDDAGVGVLMLVREAQRVADLVHGGVDLLRPAGEVPAEVHGALVAADVEHAAAEIGPGAVAAHEADAELGVLARAHLLELEPDADVLPDPERLPHHVLLGVAGGPGVPFAGAVRGEHPLAVGFPIEEVVVQRRAVRPLVVVHPYQSRPTGRHARIQRALRHLRHGAVGIFGLVLVWHRGLLCCWLTCTRLR